MKLNVLTRCTRVQNLQRVEDTIFNSSSLHGVEIKWSIIFDTSVIPSIDTEIFEKYSGHDLKFWKGTPGDMGHMLLNRAIDGISGDEWLYVLDDDNTMHEDFLEEISKAVSDNPSTEAIIVSQFVGGKDFSGVQVREALPENVKVQKIDMAQFVLKKSVLGEKRLVPMTYVADGMLIEDLYNTCPMKFTFLNKILCNYNALLGGKSYTLPRVSTRGECSTDLKSMKIADFESNDLNIERLEEKSLVDHDPDCILSFGETYENYHDLLSTSPDMKLRWVHIPHENFETGEVAYRCAMNYILKTSMENEMISVFTPIHKTREKLRRTYSSLEYQTYNNWEWVIVDDSEDAETTRIAEEIASKDPRVRIYNFKQKSKGIIGEAKYRACMLSRGKYLAELDHDDMLLPRALEKVHKAFTDFPDAGFVYTDCAEISEDYSSLMYGEGFAFGYGKYRDEEHLGMNFKIAVTPNINPVTIRHIVGVPNHLRVWKKSDYMAVGGHNRRLSIADDYELIVRTFLHTKMVRVPEGCYLQFHHGGNSQNATRSDIQRRVRTIASFYSLQIKERFESLGKEDWAFDKNIGTVEKRTGKNEEFVNYIAIQQI